MKVKETKIDERIHCARLQSPWKKIPRGLYDVRPRTFNLKTKELFKWKGMLNSSLMDIYVWAAQINLHILSDSKSYFFYASPWKSANRGETQRTRGFFIVRHLDSLWSLLLNWGCIIGDLRREFTSVFGCSRVFGTRNEHIPPCIPRKIWSVLRQSQYWGFPGFDIFQWSRKSIWIFTACTCLFFPRGFVSIKYLIRKNRKRNDIFLFD